MHTLPLTFFLVRILRHCNYIFIVVSIPITDTAVLWYCLPLQYEFMVLSDLVGQGNPLKVGDGIAAFQVRMHQKWQSRCYYLIRKDGSEDDFSYRKCVDALMPLPASLYRKNGELDLEKLFPGQKGRHHREQNGGGRGGGRGDRGGRGGGGDRGYHGRRGGGGGRGGGGRRGGRGRW